MGHFPMSDLKKLQTGTLYLNISWFQHFRKLFSILYALGVAGPSSTRHSKAHLQVLQFNPFPIKWNLLVSQWGTAGQHTLALKNTGRIESQPKACFWSFSLDFIGVSWPRHVREMGLQLHEWKAPESQRNSLKTTLGTRIRQLYILIWVWSRRVNFGHLTNLSKIFHSVTLLSKLGLLSLTSQTVPFYCLRTPLTHSFSLWALSFNFT